MSIIKILIYKVYSKIKTIYFDINTTSKFSVDVKKGKDLYGFKGSVIKAFNSIEEIKKRKNICISAVYRLHNAEDTLYLSVLSTIPLVDEFIFVDNNSTDDTKNIIAKCISLCEKKGKLFKVVDYPIKVNVQGQNYKENLKLNPSGSLARYYNFAFNHATYDFVFKVDCHMILKPGVFIKIIKSLEKYKVAYLRGQNIYGRSMSYEPRIYHKSISNSYRDGEYFEYLDISVNEITRIKARISERAYWHIGVIL